VIPIQIGADVGKTTVIGIELSFRTEANTNVNNVDTEKAITRNFNLFIFLTGKACGRMCSNSCGGIFVSSLF